MSLIALIAAFVWEHFRPENPDIPRAQARRWMAWLQANVNAGGERHGLLAWSLGVALPALLVGLVALALHAIWLPLGWLFDVAVLYLCLGFKRASDHASQIGWALGVGKTAEARAELHAWRPDLLLGETTADLTVQTAEEVLRQGLVRLLGVAFWFVLLGAMGAVLFMLANLARNRWHGEARFGQCANRTAYILEWVPVRLTALSFAIVGNFQDAMDCWRGQARTWGDEHDGILLAAGGGALRLQLGGDIALASEAGPGADNAASSGTASKRESESESERDDESDDERGSQHEADLGLELSAELGAEPAAEQGAASEPDPEASRAQTIHSKLLRPELGIGERPEPAAIDGVIALVLRVALLWAAALGLFLLGGA